MKITVTWYKYIVTYYTQLNCAMIDTDTHTSFVNRTIYTIDFPKMNKNKHNAELRGTAPGAYIPKNMFLGAKM